MGRRMSGRPSWALYEPSVNSTSECTTLWGWITASILLYGRPYNHLASMASNALLTSVAESMVILGPIRQVGCASASAGVTRLELGRRPVRGTGRREAVSTRRATVSMPFPEQALPDGRMLAVDRPQPVERVAAELASSTAATRWPPVTSVSLLASATRRPARRAASTAGQRGHAGGGDHHDVDAIGGRRAPPGRRRPSVGASSSGGPPVRRPGARVGPCRQLRREAGRCAWPAARPTTRNGRGARR